MVRDLDPLPGVDLVNPSAARVYDHWLGGTANWAIDREFARRAELNLPIVRELAKTNREFVQRAVAFLVKQDVTQFLDLGSGIPTVRNVHEVADELGSHTRVVYVDYEPVAVAHANILLETHGDPQRHAMVQANLLHAREVWQSACETGVINPEEPVGIIAGAVLHFMVTNEVHDALADYRGLVAPGSALALTHVTDVGVPRDQVGQLRSFVGQYGEEGASPACLRSPAEIASFFGDFTLEPPGLVWLPQWNLGAYQSPVSRTLVREPTRSCVLGGLAWKRSDNDHQW